MSEIEPTLERGLSIGLRQAAEDVLAIDAEVAGNGVRLGLPCRLGCRGGGLRLNTGEAGRSYQNEKRGECTEFEAHEELPWLIAKNRAPRSSAQGVPSGKVIEYQSLRPFSRAGFAASHPSNCTITVRLFQPLCRNGAGDGLGRAATQHGVGFC